MTWVLDRANLVHHRTNELLTEQNSISGGQSLLFKRAPNTLSLCHFLSRLLDMSRPIQPFIEGHAEITGDIDSVDWLHED